jgi:hypothetical protein
MTTSSASIGGAAAVRRGTALRCRLAFIAAISFTVIALCPVPALADQSDTPKSSTPTLRVPVVSTAADQVTVLTGSSNKTLSAKGLDTSSNEMLQTLQPGDLLTIEVDDATNPSSVSKIESVQRPVNMGPRVLIFGASALLFFLVATAATGGHPLKFLIGVDNRYSNSQCQLVLWFGAVATMYLGTVALRARYLGLDYLGGVGITENLVALTGLSALSFGGAKAITGTKVDNAAQAGLPPVKAPAARANLLTDLFTNDHNQADLGDFQMILITVVAVLMFGISAFHSTQFLLLSHSITLPDIDSTMLAGFGIGQGAYLAKKAAMKPGDG